MVLPYFPFVSENECSSFVIESISQTALLISLGKETYQPSSSAINNQKHTFLVSTEDTALWQISLSLLG